MFAPRTPQNGSRNLPRTSSSKANKNQSKPRCEAWVPLNGWEQSDDAESDVFYLAIDAWAKRNSKIKADAPKGVPSSKLWEPFLCTTDNQCTGILDFEAFVNVSLSLHKDIDVKQEECRQKESNGTDLSNDSSKTTKAEANDDGIGNEVAKVKIQDEQPSEICQSDKKENDQSTKEEKCNEDEKRTNHLNKTAGTDTNKDDNSCKKKIVHLDIPDKVTRDFRNVEHKDTQSSENLGLVSHDPGPLEGADGEAISSESVPDWNARNGTSHSAPVSRTQQREPLKRRLGSAGTKSAEDRLRRAALKKATKTKVNSKKVSVTANPVKISYAHAGNARPGIFAGELLMGETSDSAENTQIESQTDETPRRISLDNRLLIEEAIKDSKKIDYMTKTSVVSIGDLLSTAPRLERRLGKQSKGRESMYAAMANENEDASSRDSFGTLSSSPRPPEDIRSPSSSSLPPVPVTSRQTTPVRDVHSSEGRKPGSKQAVNLHSAKIPVISYRKGVSRDFEEDEEGDNANRERETDLADVRYIKRLLKSALSRGKSRVHSADHVRQIPQVNDTTTQQTTKSGGKKDEQKSKLQVECDRDKNRLVSQVLGKHRSMRRGPPAFRPQSFKTPLQRAVENAHKRMYGQHYYLFNNSGASGTENGEDIRNGMDSAKTLRAQSANGETTNAYVWKENIESQQRHRRKANTTSVQIGEVHDIRWRHSTHPLTALSSVVEHYVNQSLGADYSGTEKSRAKTTNGHAGYNVSDFRPNFRRDTLKTERRKTIQR
ncbi:uncharacterized protein LOC121423736 isoform X2 [Lytechinus variegatus]|uniref:uncharacterized protein LOC121423736 isoform X2 n=1 Tax=Lytechinus variegatus TaxID=7654 RepID=UPI001BB1B7DB|nr:uncharacterized protein LOC121423736 isoform X2 [Lytechinus variegatus]